MRLRNPLLGGVPSLCAALLIGCAAPGTPHKRNELPAPVMNQSATDASPVATTLQAISELPQVDPGRQAEMFEAARIAAEQTPTTANRLKFALVLATPGHVGADPVAAQRQLSELLATPETLLPIEQYLASTELRQVDRQLVLDAENRRLRDEAPREARDKLAAVNRRLAAETDENVKLHKELDEARAKLDAISHIERSINDRGTSGTGATKE